MFAGAAPLDAALRRKLELGGAAGLNSDMQSPERFAAGLLRQGARACAVAAVEALAQRRPELLAHGLPSTFADPVEDTRMRLLTLAESLDVDRPELLAWQIAWYKIALAHRGVAADYLTENLRAIRSSLLQELPSGCHDVVARHLAHALQRADEAPTELPSWLEGDAPLRDEARRFLLAVLENRRRDALDLVVAAHAAGASVADVHDHLLCPVQREIGRMWLMAEIPIADEHFTSRVVESCLDRLASLAPAAPRRGRSVLTFAVGGDLHGIAIRMVAERFEMHGFDVWDLGADMPASDFEWMLQDRRVDLIVLGATLVLHVSSARQTIARLRTMLGPACPPILVGGGPFAVVDDLFQVLGADAAATDPATAVARGEALLRGR